PAGTGRRVARRTVADRAGSPARWKAPGPRPRAPPRPPGASGSSEGPTSGAPRVVSSDHLDQSSLLTKRGKERILPPARMPVIFPPVWTLYGRSRREVSAGVHPPDAPPGPGYRWQATQWPGVTSRRGGSTRGQASMTLGQRV